jgi:TctA family transporter
MTITRKTLINSFWFALEVIGIFVVVQFIRFAIGNLNAFYIGLSLMLIAAMLFGIAFLIARSKNRQNSGKSREKTYTRLFG